MFKIYQDIWDSRQKDERELSEYSFYFSSRKSTFGALYSDRNSFYFLRKPGDIRIHRNYHFYEDHQGDFGVMI